MGRRGKREFVQVLQLMENFRCDEVHEGVCDALRLGAVNFDAVKHLVLCRIEGRPQRLDLELYPYLPKVTVRKTSASDYMALRGDTRMPEQATFGDFILGLEGLAILRSWMSDPATVTARTRKIVEIVSHIEEAPWTNPMAASERTVAAGYAEWAATYDVSNNPMFLAEGPVLHGLLDRYPLGAALDAACGTGRHAAYPGVARPPGYWYRLYGRDAESCHGEGACGPVPDCRPDGDSPFGWRGGPNCLYAGVDALLGVHGGYRRNPAELGFDKNNVHLTSDYLTAFREAGLNILQCIKPLWGDREIATMGFAEQMPDLMEAAVKGIPIVIVWELEKSA